MNHEFDISGEVQGVLDRLGSLRGIAAGNFKQVEDEEEDVGYFRFLIEQIDKLKRLEEAQVAIHGQYEEIRNALGCGDESSSEVSATKLRRLSVEISEGMINQSIIALTQARKRGVVRVGEKMRVFPPSGEMFETEIVSPGNRLRERGRIAKFYEDENVEEGDVVLFEETETGSWKMRRQPRPVIDIEKLFDLPSTAKPPTERTAKP